MNFNFFEVGIFKVYYQKIEGEQDGFNLNLRKLFYLLKQLVLVGLKRGASAYFRIIFH